MGYKKKTTVVGCLCADDETRTHTGQRPLPPQSSVSTISPRPQYFGTAKIRTNLLFANLFRFFCNFYQNLHD